MVRITKDTLRSALKDTKLNGATHVKTYLSSLIPIISWLPRYSTKSFFGDLIAGVTVGLVVIPQALSYAKLAGVPLQFGLYTSFVGVLCYGFLATSKDVTIGPTAVLSTLVGQLLASYNTQNLDPVVFVTSLAFLSGMIQAAIGLLRLGILIDLISVPVVVGFTTGAALQIIFGQISSLMGVPGISTNDAPYLVLYNTLKNLNHAHLDAVFGWSAIAILVLVRVATYYAVKRGYKWFIWIGHSANIITLVSLTLVSWLSFRNVSHIPIKIVGIVPSGLTYVKVPATSNLSSLLSPAISIVLVGIIEHIAMTKAFGRLNGYRADSNQEIVALGVTNIIAPFFGAFPATGSLSRSSIKSRSGVRTPLSELFTGLIVLLAIYFVTPAFYYIPSSVLSGIIIGTS